jgi:AcrR family transcriptional regulator
MGDDERPGENASGIPLRRLPAQRRSAIRVDRILDAAGQLVAERGYEKMTTSHIALRAGVSPGMLYQFFADKRAVVRALSARNVERYTERLEDAISSGEFARWQDVTDAAIDLFVAMCRDDPGFLAVQFGDVVDAQLLDPASDNDSYLAGRLAVLLTGEFGVAADERLQLALVLAIKIADVLVRFAFTLDPAGDDAVIRHTKALVRQHLDLALAGPGAL